LGDDVERPALVITNPFRGQRLAVPRDVRSGDTPEGEPAVLWRVPNWVSRDLKSPDYARVDWAVGGRADKAIWTFIALASEPDPERFVAFVRRFGPLGLWPYRSEQTNEKGQAIRFSSLVDRDGRDIWVPSIPVGILTPDRYDGPIPEDELLRLDASGLLNMRYEPLAEWRRWASWTRALLQISLALRDGRLGTREQWAAFGIDLADEWWGRRYRDPAHQRQTVAQLLQSRFVKWSGLVPAIRWRGERPSFELALGGCDAVLMPRFSMQHDWPENALFPAMVAHLLAIITGESRVAGCTMCGEPHQRQRLTQIAYCPLCRAKADRANKRKSAKKRRDREKQRKGSATS
jgi:hypothetical protein